MSAFDTIASTARTCSEGPEPALSVAATVTAPLC